MDPIVFRVAARFAGEVVEMRPRPGVPKIQIGGRHYALSTDSGPMMGDLAERLAPEDMPEGGARLIAPPEHANKWRYLWAYDQENQILAMWRVSDGDEKVYENAKHAGHQIVKLDKKGQLNRVDAAAFRAIEAHMRKKTDETIEELKRVVEDNKSDPEKVLDGLVREYFARHVAQHIERALADVAKGATPIGFKPHDPKAEHVSIARQASVFVISRVMKHEMTEAKIEDYLRQHKFDLEAIHNQSIEWAIQDVQDEAFEKYLPPR